jgi:hypothetical protein
MGVASLASTIFDREPSIIGRWLLLLCLTLLGAGCASKQVVVEGKFPAPLLDPLPITMGVIYPSAFAQHEFFDEAKGRAESDWLVKTGEAQVEFWDILLTGLFDEVVHIRDWETVQARSRDIDGVLIPAIAELQYTIPTHTNVKVYEIWMRYEFRLVDIGAIHQQEDGALSFNLEERIAQWPITAYGKTPTAFLQSDEDAVNLAAVVALRDAGAHFITTFGRTPDVAAWLNDIANRAATESGDDPPVAHQPESQTAAASISERERTPLADASSAEASPVSIADIPPVTSPVEINDDAAGKPNVVGDESPETDSAGSVAEVEASS